MRCYACSNRRGIAVDVDGLIMHFEVALRFRQRGNSLCLGLGRRSARVAILQAIGEELSKGRGITGFGGCDERGMGGADGGFIGRFGKARGGEPEGNGGE